MLGACTKPASLSRVVALEKTKQKATALDRQLVKEKPLRTTSSGRNSQHLNKVMSVAKAHKSDYTKPLNNYNLSPQDLMGKALHGPVKRHTLGQDYLFKKTMRRKKAEDVSRLKDMERENVLLQNNVEEYQQLLKVHGLVDKSGKLSKPVNEKGVPSETVTISSEEDLERDLELHKQMPMDEKHGKNPPKKSLPRSNTPWESQTPPSQSHPLEPEHQNLSPLSDQIVNDVYSYHRRISEKLEAAKAKLRSERESKTRVGESKAEFTPEYKGLVRLYDKIRSDYEVSLIL